MGSYRLSTHLDDKSISILYITENEALMSNLINVFSLIDTRLTIDLTSDPEPSLSWHHMKMYNITICDYSIPKLNGLEILRILRQEGNNNPFIMIIKDVTEEIVQEIQRLGADLYIQNKYGIYTLTLQLSILISHLTEKENHYKELIRLEKQYKALTENNSVGFWSIAINGHVLYMNKVMMDILDIESIEEINWENMFAFVSTESQANSTKNLEKSLSGVGFSDEIVLTSKNGKKCFGIISSVPLKNEEGKIDSLIGTFTDLNRFVESQHTFDTLTELLPLGISVTRKNDGKILYINKRSSELIGLAKTQLVNSDGRIFYPSLQEREKFIEKIDTEHIVRNYQFNSLKADKTPYWAEVSSQLIVYNGEEALLNVVDDITERKKNEIQQKILLSRLKVLIDNLPYGILFEDENRRIAHINQYLCTIYNFSLPPEEFIGLAGQEFILCIQNQFMYPEDFIARIEEILMNKSFSFNNEFKLVDGRILESTSIPIYAEKVYCGQLWQVSDITNRRIIEDKLKRERSELSVFAHEMAHDLRNILAAIEGYATLLTRENYNILYVESIIKLIKKSQIFLQQSLRLADSGEIINKKSEVDLNTIMQQTAEIIIPKNIHFQCESLPKVLGDGEKIYQIIKNLLENAVVHGKPTNIVITYKKSTNYGIIDIINDGIIINNTIKTNLEKGESIGFGYKIVKKLITAHGWNITILNNTQTVFEISIPVQLIR